jgi:hypothetical protein
MPRGRLAAALAAALLPAAAAAQPTGDFVEVFRAGCLAHLPDFAGSPAAFEGLGFERTGARFEREDGAEMLAELYERTVDRGRGCVLAAQVGEGAEVVPRSRRWSPSSPATPSSAARPRRAAAGWTPSAGAAAAGRCWSSCCPASPACRR